MDQLLGPVKVSPVRQGRNTHHHRAMTEETGDVRGVQRVLLTFRHPGFPDAPDGQALVSLNLQPVSNGHMPLHRMGQTRETSLPSAPSQMRDPPQHTGPHTGLSNSVNDGAHAGTTAKLSEEAAEFSAGWILLGPL